MAFILHDNSECNNFFNNWSHDELLITGKPFGIIMSGIGVIALAGIVVNNNIVLLDTILIPEKGENIREAIIRADAQKVKTCVINNINNFF